MQGIVHLIALFTYKLSKQIELLNYWMEHPVK